MKTFSINTLGCKVNQYESQQIQGLLEQFGLRKIKPPKKPDLVVINTCCVTHTASSKSRQYIRKAQKLSPDAVVVVCGCLPTVQIGELHNISKQVHIIKDREKLADALNKIAGGHCAALNFHSPQSCSNTYTNIKAQNGLKIKFKKDLNNHLKLPILTAFQGQTRAFLKIQDGCDGHCSYCIIPQTRPIVHSKPVETVLKEAKSLVKAGHKEIVVTGVFLGAYGQTSVRRISWPNQENVKLANLLDKLAKIPHLERIRLSSLEPGDITEQFLDILCKHSNIMPHLHLSLQSGSNTILKKMRRQYSSDIFTEKVALVKQRLDRPAITTDIIVGFPGETDDDFKQTVNLAKDAGFTKIHIFSFSPREGTPAAKMPDRVNIKNIKERSKILHRLDTQLRSQFQRQFIGETAEILLENNDEQIYGLSERYFRVYPEKTKKKLMKNDLIKVKLVRYTNDALYGEVL
ncbi:MAG: tRNA (N(6)-L-threonylcarbamoyladenosine(37)-C(2))-methylthiotransferase MtaB [Sedimentisphaerales bacterium]|nr:tRNA (N(6)-L-threonylcarbamoyladenosine(37)-C(2))-methylthiotransferase MtaB [Sedimentisphaerales bacterium]